MSITYELLTIENKADLNMPNRPFPIRGQMIVTRTNNEWQHDRILFDNITTMVFPQEHYSFSKMKEQGDAFAAYDGELCVGLAIYQHHWNKFLYLHDLKVNPEYRQRGIASKLIQLGLEYAISHQYKGIYTVGQDNNLNACEFYLSQGFVIGGYNNMDYQGTLQEGKSDIYFYLNS